MKQKYTKQDFLALDTDDQCLIVEALIPLEYYEGQEQIGFYVPEDYDPESGEAFPPIPPEIEKEEEEKLKKLVISLADVLFKDKEYIILT